MNKKDLLEQILALLYQIKDDKTELKKLYAFLTEEIFEEREMNEEEESINIPEKYQNLVKEVADSINAGMVCYINKDTLAFEYIPEAFINGEFEDVDDTFQKILDQIEIAWEHTIQIEPPGSNIGYNIMAKFTEKKVNDSSLKLQLENALNRKKPFRNFKNIVESSPLRENWFEFKQKEMEKYVWEELEYYLFESE